MDSRITLLAGRLPGQASPTQRDRWLGAVCAELAVAYAESLTVSHDTAAGVTYLAQLRAHFPRHVAFRGELDTANSNQACYQQRRHGAADR